MSFDWFLILLPVVLAVGALIKVLTSKPPAYKRKQKTHGDSSGSGGDSGTMSDSSYGSRKQESDTSGRDADTGGDGGGGDGGGGGD